MSDYQLTKPIIRESDGIDVSTIIRTSDGASARSA